MNSIRNPTRNLIALPKFVGEEPDLLRQNREPASKPFVSSLEKLKRKVNVSLPVVKLAK